MRDLFTLFIFLLLLACSKEPEGRSLTGSDLAAKLTKAPLGFEEIPFPVENSFSLEKWKMGKRLFYDIDLSQNRSISCGSCHKANLAFSDDVPVSAGVEGRLGKRNSPSLANVAYFPYFMREGGVPSLEMQILVPIQEHAEFDFNVLELVERLKEDTSYLGMSKRAFDRELDAYTITRSIATFERTLVSGESRYDKHMQNGEALTSSEERGMELFFSDRTSCRNCHSGLFFTNHSFQNNGLYEVYNDVGRFSLTADSSDLHLFKVPSLRNVALGAPYMHDGSIGSLKEVVDHYNSGGQDYSGKSTLIRPLNLSENEVNDIVSFLQALTDVEFTSNTLYHEE